MFTVRDANSYKMKCLPRTPIYMRAFFFLTFFVSLLITVCFEIYFYDDINYDVNNMSFTICPFEGECLYSEYNKTKFLLSLLCFETFLIFFFKRFVSVSMKIPTVLISWLHLYKKIGPHLTVKNQLLKAEGFIDSRHNLFI